MIHRGLVAALIKQNVFSIQHEFSQQIIFTHSLRIKSVKVYIFGAA